MDASICVTCGTQFPPSPTAPAECPICLDDRQYVGQNGQQWTTLATLRAERINTITELAPNLWSIRTDPAFAIGQQAHVIRTPNGNVLWDCISLLDDATVEWIREQGGINAIGISHAHFYSSMVEWSCIFNAPIWLHSANKPWVMRPDDAIRYWDGDKHELLPGVTLVRCGGHFPGSTALHWAGGADGAGALFTADTITVVQDRQWVSFMYSYPNLIPLHAEAVQSIADSLEPFAFDRIYGGWPGSIVASDAHNAVRRSAARYIAHLRGPEAKHG